MGSRKCTLYGEIVTKKFAEELVLRGIVLISGMAVGIDSIAHRTCLNFKGKTIAVLGFGFNYISEREDKELFEEILKSEGLLISEYLPEKKERSENYRERNRIISGLSEGVIVVEGRKRSGSTITGNYAIKQNKKLFVIPNNIFEKTSQGTNELIKKGGYLLTDIEDILEKIPEIPKEKRICKKKKNEKIKTKFIEIFELIECGINEKEDIINKTGKSTQEVNSLLIEMELEGIIEYKIGKGYVAKERMID